MSEYKVTETIESEYKQSEYRLDLWDDQTPVPYRIQA